MSDTHRVRRGLLWKRVVVALLLGAVVNVLVAAFIVYRVGMSPPDHYTDQEYDTLAARASFRWSRYQIPAGLHVPPIEEQNEELWSTATLRRYAYSSGVGITRLEFEEDVNSIGSSRWYEGSRARWPLYSFRTDLDERWYPEIGDYVTYSGETDFEGGIDAWTLPEWVKDSGLKPAQEFGLFGGRARSPYGPHEYFAERRIPLRPMSLGFAVNTLFYAMVFLFLFTGVLTLRRVHRHRRGLCTRCKYDRTGLPAETPCPECETVL